MPQYNEVSNVRRVYLDYSNGSPLSPQVQAAIQDALNEAANPSSMHAEGRAGSRRLEVARAQVAALVGARPEEVVFTSSGSEANLWALKGLAEAVRGSTGSPRTVQKNHLVLSAVEHLSLLQSGRRMEKEGWSVTLVPVDGHGRVEPEQVERALTPQTALVSVQWANAEVGTLQPVAEIARRVRARGILFHSDAVAAAGQVPVALRAGGVDALSLAGNAFGGPSGVGALVVRKGVRILPLFVGGAQEEGRRAGTENILGIVGMGAAAELARGDLAGLAGRLVGLRERLICWILKRAPQARLNGHPVERLPGHASVRFPGMDGEQLLLTLDMEGIAVGLGSACTARTLKASHVLRAMGVPDSEALGTITCTMGPGAGEDDVERLLEALPRALAVVQRGQTPLYMVTA